MFGLGWAEILVAGIVGLIVIGPKELPVVFRKIGQFVGKAKGMAQDFSRAMNDAADESGMKDAMESMNSLKDGVRSVTDPTTKWQDFVPGAEFSKDDSERADKAKKMHDAMANKAQGRLDSAKATSGAAETYVAPKKPTVKKAAVKHSAAAKRAAKAPAKTPAKVVPAQKLAAVAKKEVPKKPAAKPADPQSGKTT
jgi:sec-independent protein translocase protein TatB